MHTKKKTEAIELRKQGLTYSMISEKLGVAKSSISLWCRNLELTTEQQALLNTKSKTSAKKGGDVRSLQCLERRLLAQERGRSIIKSGASKLFIMGCMLFWAEGSKGRNVMSFCNTDPEMVKLFLKFLLEELNIDSNKIILKVSYHFNPDLDISKIQNFWLDTTGLKKENLRKPSRIDQNIRSSGFKKNKHPMGVCHLLVNSVDVIQTIFGAIKELGGIEDRMKWAV